MADQNVAQDQVQVPQDFARWARQACEALVREACEQLEAERGIYRQVREDKDPSASAEEARKALLNVEELQDNLHVFASLLAQFPRDPGDQDQTLTTDRRYLAALVDDTVGVVLSALGSPDRDADYERGGRALSWAAREIARLRSV